MIKVRKSKNNRNFSLFCEIPEKFITKFEQKIICSIGGYYVAKKRRVKTKRAKPAKQKPAEKEKQAQLKLEEAPKEDPLFREILTRIAGEPGYQVAAALVEKELTDDEVAKKTGIRINLVRKVLYDLYDSRVVGYRRVRDESSGWYIYYWRIEPDRAKEFVESNRHTLFQKLNERLEEERNTMYFACHNGCPKVTFDVAVENDFKCPKCGNKLERYDNSNVITALEHQVESLKQHLAGT